MLKLAQNKITSSLYAVLFLKRICFEKNLSRDKLEPVKVPFLQIHMVLYWLLLIRIFQPIICNIVISRDREQKPVTLSPRGDGKPENWTIHNGSFNSFRHPSPPGEGWNPRGWGRIFSEKSPPPGEKIFRIPHPGGNFMAKIRSFFSNF